MSYTLRTIQELIGGELVGNEDEEILGINALDAAQAGELTFAEDDRYAPQVRVSRASAIIVSPKFPPIADKNLLRVANPRVAFMKVTGLFRAAPSTPAGIHPTAVVSSQAHLADEVTVAEYAVIRADARIGRGTVIESGAHVGMGVVIGEDCFIGPNVVLMHGARVGSRVLLHGGTVIGADGFGYVWAEGRHAKIPQLGNVIIEDDVELGANVCVDRATFGSTIIRRGTKVDNLVQIAHNDVIGEDVIITGQVGFAGSVTVGNRAMFGGQSGVVDHITIGDDARIGAATPVTKDVKAGEMVWGFPARPIARVKRELAALSQLPKLLQRMRQERKSRRGS
ncbi:MAG: UDP-3-O-(3-hydroxymyristoyl)glucosamine N-acyltransferase [Candidatus Omnitrophica bacterium]|nr:UDP-3-O-(3-hydroxymyristoyl)glucosamine N-acyltransferase [Candidatus Omnitrophota bacterium]